MTYLVDRLAELRRHLDHLREIRPSIPDADALKRDLSLHNDVMFSLLMVAQLVIYVSGELVARRGIRFEDYTEAVRNLAALDGIPAGLPEKLARLPGFRNVLLHDYAVLDYGLVLEALDDLDPVQEFIRAVATYEATAK